VLCFSLASVTHQFRPEFPSKKTTNPVYLYEYLDLKSKILENAGSGGTNECKYVVNSS
jgi:hypothetical protein